MLLTLVLFFSAALCKDIVSDVFDGASKLVSDRYHVEDKAARKAHRLAVEERASRNQGLSENYLGSRLSKDQFKERVKNIEHHDELYVPEYPRTGETKTYHLKAQRLPYNGDGYPRIVAMFNEQVPGPTISCNVGDELVINVENELPGEDLTVHWHGLLQKGTPWFDGVSKVTECGIRAQSFHQYRFFCDQQPGTFWYHSHTEGQYLSTLSGMIVIRDPETDVYRGRFSGELEMMVSDANYEPERTMLGNLLGPKNFWTSAKKSFTTAFPFPAGGVLINGVGRSACTAPFMKRDPFPGGGDFTCDRQTAPDLPVFKIPVGETYRLRLVNSGDLLPLQLTIEGHSLNVIGRDGFATKEKTVDFIVIDLGQRYDVLLKASQAPGRYRIKVQDTIIAGRGATAWLQVGDSETPVIAMDPGFTPLSKDAFDEQYKFPAYHVPRILLDREPDHVFNYDFESVIQPDTGPHEKFFVNGVSFEIPRVPVLQSAYLGDEYDGKQYVFKVKYGDVVEMTILNRTPFTHPIHTHGHKFAVVAWGDNIDTFDRKKMLVNKEPACADTITVQGFSWVTIRFLADNPGVWLIHCHITAHMSTGFAALLETSPDLITPAPREPFYEFCFDRKKQLLAEM